MELYILYTAAIGFFSASAVLMALYLNAKEKGKVLQSKAKEYQGCIEYYRKKTNHLRDSLASTIGQLQATRAETLSIQQDLQKQEAAAKAAKLTVRKLKNPKK